MLVKQNKCFKSMFIKIIDAVKNGEPLPVQIANFKGSRGSGKTAFWLRTVIVVGLIKKTKIYGFRYLSKDLNEKLIKDFLNVFNSYNLPYEYLKSEKIINFGNGSTISFYGLKQNKSDKINLTGLASENYLYEYGFKFKDEITEYEMSESQAIDEAIRGYKKNHVMDIRTWNPVNPLHWCNTIFKLYVPENELTMKTYGIDERISYTDENEKTEWFTQTNYLVNKMNDENLVATLKALPKTDPLRARTMTWGLDGIDDGNLFIDPNFNEINEKGIRGLIQIRREQGKDFGRWVIAMDYGLKDEIVIGLGLIVPAFGIILVESYSYWRKIQRWISDGEIAKQIFNNVRHWRNKWDLPNDIPLFYDYQNTTFAEMIIKMLDDDGIHNFYMEPCEKSPLDLRMKFLRKMIDKKKIYINIDNVKNSRLKEQIYYAIGKYNKDGILSEITTPCDWIDFFCYLWTKISYSYLNRIFEKDDDLEKNLIWV